MAEPLSLAASVIAVVGLAGQVVQGCQALRTLVGDFNSAPKDVQDLMRELVIVEDSAKTAELLGKKSDANLEAQLEPALRLCFDAVEAIRTRIADADLAFRDKDLGRELADGIV